MSKDQDYPEDQDSDFEIISFPFLLFHKLSILWVFNNKTRK